MISHSPPIPMGQETTPLHRGIWKSYMRHRSNSGHERDNEVGRL